MGDSPSSRHVNTIECGLRVVPSSTSRGVAPHTAKAALVAVGRDARRKLLLVVEVRGSRSFSATYPLSDCAIHSKAVAQGKGSIAIANTGVILQLMNAPPRKINIFLKSIEAKLELMNAERGGIKTPISKARSLLLEGVPRVFNELSPLTVAEMRKVRALRGCPMSPLVKKTTSTPSETTPGRRPKTGLRNSSLASQSIAPIDRTPLSVEQRSIVRRVVDEKENVFFTGSAGTGKSLVLRRIIELLPAQSTFVTAATGVAACQLGGLTLHSFAAIGSTPSSVEAAMNILSRNKLATKQWKDTTHLVIDEISMVDAEYFTIIEEVARRVRGKDAPFGGIQLVLTGDFLQLPPVAKQGEVKNFAFECTAWDLCVPRPMVLREVRRQQGDDNFVNILQQIRMGRCEPATVVALLESKKNVVERDGVVPTRLCTHTADANSINQDKLIKLEGKTIPSKSLNSWPSEEERVYEAKDSSFISNATAPAPPKVVLKKKAQVMLTTNLDLSRQLSNGARGVIQGFSENNWPLVHFLASNEVIEVRPVKFRARLSGGGEDAATRTQVPLQLAWAISIHKSQGLTLDAVEVSLSRVFAEGQAYVALSRARSLSSLRVLDFDIGAVRANSKVVAFYKQLMSGRRDDDEFVIFKRRRIS